MSKIFLGGTCGNSNWREEVIQKLEELGLDYFNPVVDSWTQACQDIEMVEKEDRCDTHLYVITSEMVGVFSIAEAIDSVHNKSKGTIFQVRPKGFSKSQLKSLQAVIDLINLRGGKAFMSDDLKSIFE